MTAVRARTTDVDQEGASRTFADWIEQDILTPSASRSARWRARRAIPLPPGSASSSTTSVTRRDRVFRRTLVVADLVAAAGALLMTNALVGPQQPDLVTLAAVSLLAALAKVTRLYDRQESVVRKSTLDETPGLFQVATLYALGIWLLNGLLITRTNDRRELLVSWPSLFVLLLFARGLARAASRHLTTPERCVVIGDVLTCEHIKAKLALRPSLHASVVAAWRTDSPHNEDSSMHVLANQGDLQALSEHHRVNRIIIAPESADADQVLNVIRAATSLGLKVSVVPRLLEVVGSSIEFDEVAGMPLLSMRSFRLSRSSRMVKRVWDIAASAVGLVIVTPLMFVIAIVIKIDSPGPLLFRQRRVGRNGEPFEMLKFRTMVDGAHEQRDELDHLNETQGLFKIAADPRITRLGRLLRRVSLDELPQLWNVLRGDMSLVGPRPLVVEEDSRVQGWYRRRLDLTPGMTGHWQILGSTRIPLHEMLNIDYLYVTNWSLWNDVKILLRTIPYVMGGRGV